MPVGCLSVSHASLRSLCWHGGHPCWTLHFPRLPRNKSPAASRALRATAAAAHVSMPHGFYLKRIPYRQSQLPSCRAFHVVHPRRPKPGKRPTGYRHRLGNSGPPDALGPSRAPHLSEFPPSTSQDRVHVLMAEVGASQSTRTYFSHVRQTLHL